MFAKYATYDEKEIAEAVSKLPYKYRQIIYKRYGESLDSDIINLDLSNSERQLIYSVISDLIEQNLQELRKINKKSRRNTLIERFSQFDKEVFFEAISYLDTDEVKILKQRYGEDYDSYITVDEDTIKEINIIIKKLKKIIDKIMKSKRSDILRSIPIDFSGSNELKEMVMREDFLNYFSTLTIRESTVCSLVFGYTGEYLSTLKVSNMLNSDIVEINKIVIKVIRKYSILIDSSFDEKTLYVKKKDKK